MNDEAQILHNGWIYTLIVIHGYYPDQMDYQMISIEPVSSESHLHDVINSDYDMIDLIKDYLSC